MRAMHYGCDLQAPIAPKLLYAAQRKASKATIKELTRSVRRLCSSFETLVAVSPVPKRIPYDISKTRFNPPALGVASNSCASSGSQCNVPDALVFIFLFHFLWVCTVLTPHQRNFSPCQSFRVPGSGWRFEARNPASSAVWTTKVRMSMSGDPRGTLKPRSSARNQTVQMSSCATWSRPGASGLPQHQHVASRSMVTSAGAVGGMAGNAAPKAARILASTLSVFASSPPALAKSRDWRG